jgi:hypothetical protein
LRRGTCHSVKYTTTSSRYGPIQCLARQARFGSDPRTSTFEIDVQFMNRDAQPFLILGGEVLKLIHIEKELPPLGFPHLQAE